jgi:hypothetical protein
MTPSSSIDKKCEALLCASPSLSSTPLCCPAFFPWRGLCGNPSMILRLPFDKLRVTEKGDRTPRLNIIRIQRRNLFNTTPGSYGYAGKAPASLPRVLGAQGNKKRPLTNIVKGRFLYLQLSISRWGLDHIHCLLHHYQYKLK